MTKAQEFCAKVRELAEESGLDFFVVTEGASAYTNNHNVPAVKYARFSHVQWERINGFDPDHEWTSD